MKVEIDGRVGCQKMSEMNKKTRKFLFQTSHLKHFDLIDRLTKLYGEEYRIIKKSLWYQIFSLTIQHIPVDVGDIHADCRIHCAYALPSGTGKKNIKLSLYKIAEKLGLTVGMPTSLHPEQLIGKVIRERVRNQIVYDKIKGHLADDVVIIDEGTELLRSRDPSYKESRKYINVALDPYKSNKISKKMVDTPREQALEYFPKCNMVLFFHPFIFNEEIVLVGTLRRFLVIYAPIEMSEERFSIRVDSETIDEEKTMEPLLKTLNEIKNKFGSSLLKAFLPFIQFSFSQASKERLKKLHLELLKQGLNHSEKAANYIKMISFPLQDWLVKMACIQAASRLRNEVTVEDVEYAYVDLAEFLQSNLDFINQRIFGNLDYGTGLNEANEDDIECLNWLIDQNAVSEETSNVTIRAFITKIMDICGLNSDATATYRYNRMKKLGWIDSKQVGQYSTKVWIKQGIKDNKGNNICLGEFTMEEYSKIVDK